MIEPQTTDSFDVGKALGNERRYKIEMTGEEESAPNRRRPPSPGRPRRIVIATFLGVLLLFADLAVLRWAVPWADEHYKTIYGSGGYVIVYFVVFLTVMTLLVLVTYVLEHESYPSDRWQ